MTQLKKDQRPPRGPIGNLPDPHPIQVGVVAEVATFTILCERGLLGCLEYTHSWYVRTFRDAIRRQQVNCHSSREKPSARAVKLTFLDAGRNDL